MNVIKTENGEVFAREIELEKFIEYYRMAESYLKNGGRAYFVHFDFASDAVVFEKETFDFEALLSELSSQTGFVQSDQEQNLYIHRSAEDNALKDTLLSYWENGSYFYENNKGEIVAGRPCNYGISPLEQARQNFRRGGVAYIKPSSGTIIFAPDKLDGYMKVPSEFHHPDEKFNSLQYEIELTVEALQKTSILCVENDEAKESHQKKNVDIEELRQAIENSQMFTISPDGTVIFPDKADDETDDSDATIISSPLFA